MSDLEHICKDRQLEFGREEKNHPSLADLTIGHAVKDYIRGSWGKIIGIIFDNDIIMETYDNGNIVWYDNHTIFEFDLFKLYDTSGEAIYYINRQNAELELEEAIVRKKYGKEDWPDICTTKPIKSVHLKKTAYQMRSMDIADEECDFVNQDKDWISYLATRRKENFN